MNGLKEFLSQVESLPCSVPEAQLLQQRLSEVERFQHEATVEIQRISQLEVAETQPVSRLEELIATGEELEIAIPETEHLKLVSGDVYMYMYI